MVERTFLLGGLPVPEGKDSAYRDAFTSCLKMTKALYDAKVPLVAGTDTIGGLTLGRELELLVLAGIPPATVLQMATLGAARVMKLDKTSGSITAGKDADLILVPGDPLKDVGEVRRVEKTVLGGTVWDSQEVMSTVGVAPASP
jgi:imidazolonepropionase-like amidohydrolase